VVPDRCRLEMIHRLSEPLKDLSISRTSFDWGIPVPNDPKHCLYVWMDALINYCTGAVVRDPVSTWPPNLHVIGKDINWFHSVIWIGILLSSKLELPKQILVHNFITDSDGQKMSKTLGNTIDIDQLLTNIPVSTLRYYLLKKSSLNTDLRFNEHEIKVIHNSELADGIGNLSHRLLALTKKYYDCQIPTSTSNLSQIFDLTEVINTTFIYVTAYNFNQIVSYLNEKIHLTNQYINIHEPWTKNKTDEQRIVVIRTALEALYTLACLWAPIQPSISKELLSRLGQSLPSSMAHFDPSKMSGTVTIGPPLFSKYSLEVPK
jgi:methionyl-tRNA synthetase